MSDTAQPVPELATTSLSNNTSPLLRSEPHKVAAGRGFSWLTEGWALFMKEPLVFSVMSVISLVAIFILGLVPFLGGLAITLLWPAMMAGFFLAFKHAKQQQAVTANDLFEPFKAPANLLGVGALYLLAGTVLILVLGIVAFMSLGSVTDIMNGNIDMGRLAVGGILMLLISIPASLALAMAFVFAPVLVHQHQVPVVAAIKRSFAGSLRNILPFIVFFVVLTVCLFVISIFVAIPLLGWLLGIAVAIVYLPLFCGALYCAYCDIFLDHNSAEL